MKKILLLIMVLCSVVTFAQEAEVVEETPKKINVNARLSNDTDVLTTKDGTYAYADAGSTTIATIGFSTEVAENINLLWGLDNFFYWNVDASAENTGQFDVDGNEFAASIGAEFLGIKNAYLSAKVYGVYQYCTTDWWPTSLVGFAPELYVGAYTDGNEFTFSLYEYFNPMFAISTEDKLIYNDTQIKMNVNLFDMYTEKLDGGLYLKYEFEGTAYFFDGGSIGYGFVNELTTGLYYDVPTNVENTAFGVKTGFAYLNYISNSADATNDYGAHIAVLGQYKLFKIELGMLPMYCTATDKGYLRTEVSFSIN